VGFASKIAGGVRRIFQQDKTRAAAGLAKGALVPPGLPGGLLAAFGNDHVSEYLRLDADLLTRFADYEEMDDYPELATSLDIYADDATQNDSQTNRTLWVTSKDENLKMVLDDLFHRTLRMDEEIWEIARSLCKYGNDYEEILVTEEGVRGLNFLPAPTVRRIEGPRGDLMGFLQDFSGRTGFTPMQFQEALRKRIKLENPETPTAEGEGRYEDNLIALEDWEVAHFRLRTKQRRSVYGHSVLDPARWIWKRLMLLEDAALVYRLQRAPERYAMYVDVGDLPPQEALAYINKVRMGHKKRKFIDPATGKLNLRWEPLVQDEDIYIPVRKGQEGARIEVLGSPAWQSMEDIEYFKNKLYAAIKVPKAYLGDQDGVARAVLSQEDVRFARTVLRVQRELRNGCRTIARVHLAALGIDPYDTDYDIWMTVPSSIFELAQLEVRNARADLASRMGSYVSLHWLLSKVFGLSDEEIECIMIERGDDMKRDAIYQRQGAGSRTSRCPPAPVVGGDGQPLPNQDAGGNPVQPPQARTKAGMPESYNPPHLRGSLVDSSRSGITEQELFAGSRETDRRADEKLEKLLKSDGLMRARLENIQGLLREIHAVAKNRR
jgi:hypothetical protein